MKLNDLGTTYDEMVESAPSSGKSAKHYPSLYLDQKQMKALGVGGARVGDELKMVATVRVRSMSESVSGGGSLDLEILEAAVSADADEPDRAKILYGDD